MRKSTPKGFSVTIKWNTWQTSASITRFTDDFIACLEGLGLETGGGCGPDTADYYVSRYEDGSYADVTAEQRQEVVLWLLNTLAGIAHASVEGLGES